MKGFKFRLESVLNYRRFQKRQCEAQLSVAVKKRQEAATLLGKQKSLCELSHPCNCDEASEWRNYLCYRA